MIANELSVRVESFCGDQRNGKSNGGREHEQRGRAECLQAGPQDHQHAEQPEHDCPNPACGHALAQHRVSQQQSPGGSGEFERKHGGQREDQQTQCPEILRSQVNGVPEKMKPPMPAVDAGAQLGIGCCNDCHYGEAEARAQRDDLHDGECRGQRTDRNRHGGKSEQRAAHPEDDAQDLAGCHEGF